MTIGAASREHTAHLGEVEREVGGALALGHRGAGEPGDVAVQLVRRLERGHGAPGPGVREQQRLQHLVAAVGREHLVGAHAVQRGDAVAQLGGGAVGIAVPLHPGQLGGERVAPRGGRREGRLVGVQAHAHVDLRRVVALEGA